MGINKTELMAIEWLKKQGYKKNEIIKTNSTPDFVCLDGKKYEVKFLYRNKLVFSYRQVEKLKNNDMILVFNNNSFVHKFLWKNKNKINFNIVVISPPKDGITMKLDKKLIKNVFNTVEKKFGFDALKASKGQISNTQAVNVALEDWLKIKGKKK